MSARPLPPEDLAIPLDVGLGGGFRPAPEVLDWIRTEILSGDGALHNPDHGHLEDAALGILWTNVPATRKQRALIGQAELVRSTGDPWPAARREEQLVGWFGELPDFTVTLYAPYCAEASDRAFAALVEHELYHCAQARDGYGMPRFSPVDGQPIFDLRGHDVEEFVGVVRRYGPVNPGVAELAATAGREPEIGETEIAEACGACLAKR